MARWRQDGELAPRRRTGAKTARSRLDPWTVPWWVGAVRAARGACECLVCVLGMVANHRRRVRVTRTARRCT